ncbi:MAG: CHAD domain-containing protein [Planctomycetota bacterium]|nr:MAG: CHAD domain-containing protein [Planctomycetota bacterium]REJ91506.1 MAG: CHAD domain-containing protein [Planctomycetota bacterium]REK27028.1 MAG: CHAD domain-containing protein [Planctomycetota bacterium]REK44375.1 MAG: CHAD domain-containing protein [Planctomycetota bacterium]
MLQPSRSYDHAGIVDGKWVLGVSRKDRISRVALLTLRHRLALVESGLPLAAQHAAEDVEHVHRLRVATRRAVAAVKMYRELLPRKRVKKLLSQLKEIRQAAGKARDLDVLLRDTAAAHRLGDDDAIFQRLMVSRREAQEPILAIYDRLRHRGSLSRQIDRVLARLERRTRRRRGDDVRFGQWARGRLSASLKRFFAAEPDDWQDAQALHRFRIRGKQLRYAMELLAGAFPKKLREQLYPQVETLQEKLGEINDHFAAIARFESWQRNAASSEDRERFEQLLQARRATVQQAQRQFVCWWEGVRRRELRRSFRALLKA